MQAAIETTDHLSPDEQTAVAIIADTINTQATDLKDAAHWLKELTGWFIYTGGSHVALHRNASDTRRVMLVTENKNPA